MIVAMDTGTHATERECKKYGVHQITKAQRRH